LPVLFLPLKIYNTKTKAGMCCSREAAKSMTGKRAGRDGRGEAFFSNKADFFFQLKRFQLKKENVYL
jgi:hypothetical protein